VNSSQVQIATHSGGNKVGYQHDQSFLNFSAFGHTPPLIMNRMDVKFDLTGSISVPLSYAAEENICGIYCGNGTNNTMSTIYPTLNGEMILFSCIIQSL